MKRLLFIRCEVMVMLLLAMCEIAVAGDLIRYSCFSGWRGQTRAGSPSGIDYANQTWDANRTYRQLVILVSFSDCDFSWDDARDSYDQIFNSPGYTLRDGTGCVADYFRDQSNGLFHLQFDIYGPYKTSGSVKTGSSKRNEGLSAFREATKLMMEENPEIDFSVYDWNCDGDIEQVVYLYAGYCGNQSTIVKEGYIWPTTGTFSSINTTDGHRINHYTASGELWVNNSSCGIGLICHEFSHCLGLPDIYPTSSEVSDLSIVDEWDLMDGGTATNRGWCPPNYSPLEKMIMGWLSPTELTGDTTITDLKPVAEGGEAYLIRHTDNEFYLLENRQWNGWDYGLPGLGLVVYHVNFIPYFWNVNNVNNVQDKPNYNLVAADGRTYTEWYNLIIESGLRNPYTDSARRLHNKILSTAPYPWLEEEHLVNQVTLFDDKRITDIVVHDDSTVSFTFHSTNGILYIKDEPKNKDLYNLSGQRVNESYKGFVIKNGKKYIVKHGREIF